MSFNFNYFHCFTDPILRSSIIPFNLQWLTKKLHEHNVAFDGFNYFREENMKEEEEQRELENNYPSFEYGGQQK